MTEDCCARFHGTDTTLENVSWDFKTDHYDGYDWVHLTLGLGVFDVELMLAPEEATALHRELGAAMDRTIQEGVDHD